MFRSGDVLIIFLALSCCCVDSKPSQLSSLSSRTVLADVVFQGRIISQPIHVNLSAVDNETVRAINDSWFPVIMVSFTVERVLKGQFPFRTVDIVCEHKTMSVGSNDKVDGTDQTRSTDEEMSIVRGSDAVVGMLYIVFVNTSRWTSGHFASDLFWSIGKLELYTPRAQRAVMSMACKLCGKRTSLRTVVFFKVTLQKVFLAYGCLRDGIIFHVFSTH